MNALADFVSQHIFDIVTGLGIISAILIGVFQNRLAARQVRAQSFLNLYGFDIQSRGPDGEDGIALIANLPEYATYEEFAQHEPQGVVTAIYNAVALLNFIATLSELGYMNTQDAWNIYFWAYRKSAEKLLPWWLDYHRRSHPHVFPAFERTCLVIREIDEARIDQFDFKRISGFAQTYTRVSGIPDAKIRGVLMEAWKRTANRR